MKQLSDDEKRDLENETRIKKLEDVNRQIYELMEMYPEDTRQRVKPRLVEATECIQECIKEVEQW